MLAIVSSLLYCHNKSNKLVESITGDKRMFINLGVFVKNGLIYWYAI